MTDTLPEIDFGLSPAPDDAPPLDGPEEAGPFAHLYPDSTPDAPYGRKPDGTPYKRHHGGRGASAGPSLGRMPASAKQAETAASLLARLNSLFGITLALAGMPNSAAELAKNNEQFEVMAREALSADPELCRKILSAGATSGKAGLVMAYVMLGVSTVPAMRNEYRENHPKELDEGEQVA